MSTQRRDRPATYNGTKSWLPGACRGGPAHCFGYWGKYDRHTCLADNHDMDTELAQGRQPCRANDKRWAEPGTLTCRFHRDPQPTTRAPWPA